MMRNENYPVINQFILRNKIKTQLKRSFFALSKYKAVKTPCKLQRGNTIHVNGTKVTLNGEKSLEDVII